MKRRPTNQKEPGQRQLRVAERIRHVLTDVLRRNDLYDPVLGDTNLITVTGVEIGPDLKHATAFVMPLGGKNAKEVAEALNQKTGYFRTELSHELDLRYAPKVSFKVDHSFDQVEHIEKLLRQEAVRRDLEKPDRDEE
jgi:ribosome-binding factor A